MTDASIADTADPSARAFSIRPMLRVEYVMRQERSMLFNASRAISRQTQPAGNSTSESGSSGSSMKSGEATQ